MRQELQNKIDIARKSSAPEPTLNVNKQAQERALNKRAPEPILRTGSCIALIGDSDVHRCTFTSG